MELPISATRTTTQLLDALHDPDNQQVWRAIDERYRPVIARFARRFALSESDADDVAQQTLTEFVRSYRDGRYQRSQGRLSSWVLGIAHNMIRQQHRNLQRHAATDDQPEATHDDPDDLQRIWSEERDREIFNRALDMLRDTNTTKPENLQAFELVALRGVPATNAAELTGLTVDQVYVAKSRITTRLRELVTTMTKAYEEDA